MLEIIVEFYKSQTNPPSPLANDRSSPSMNYIDRIEYHHLKSPQSIERYPSMIEIETRSILAGGVGRVRSQFLEFGDDF